MKTVLAISNKGDRGKTEILREFAKLLLNIYPHNIIYLKGGQIPTTGDFRLVVDINGKVVAVESEGDPGTNLENRLIDLATTYSAELILCATRTKWETVYAVEKLRTHYQFQTIWSSSYQMADKNLHHQINQLKAKHILDLLQSLHLI